MLVSEALQDLVARLAERLREEAEARVSAAADQHAALLATAQRSLSTAQAEALASRQQAQLVQSQLAEEQTENSRTQEAWKASRLLEMPGRGTLRSTWEMCELVRAP